MGAKQDKERYEKEIKAYNEKLAIIRQQEQQMLHALAKQQEEFHQSIPKLEGQHEALVKQGEIHRSLPKLEGQHEALVKQEQLPNLDDQQADEDDAPLTQQV